eukprot:TRINITY_DN8033_c0_g1_i1.p1 TRINITY_DN8033_c0_g1~~TRINITY_DN8033_c0_g1_i1.p1  ORF type:complete len:740 (+),score=203.42 TRINITY_DN8033_c0_g1_i1:109-2220(+)
MQLSPAQWYGVTVCMHALWGSYPALSRYLQADVGMPFLVMLSSAYSVICLCVGPSALSEDNRKYLLKPGTWIFASFTAVQGATNMLASHFAPAYMVQMVFLGTPFLIALVSAVWIKEPVTPLTLGAMVLCLGGAGLITAPALMGGSSFDANCLTGLLVAFVSAVALAFSLAAARGFSAPSTVLTFSFAIIGVAASAPAVLLGAGPGYSVLVSMPLNAWAAWFGMAFGVCVVGMMLLLACTKALSANVVGSMLALRLVAALGFGYIFPPHDAPTSIIQYVGIFVVIGCVSGYLYLKNREEETKKVETEHDMRVVVSDLTRRSSVVLGVPVDERKEEEQLSHRRSSHNLRTDASPIEPDQCPPRPITWQSYVKVVFVHAIWGTRLPLVLWLAARGVPTVSFTFIVPAMLTFPFVLSSSQRGHLFSRQTLLYTAVCIVQGTSATLSIDYAASVFHTLQLITPFITPGLVTIMLKERTHERLLMVAGTCLVGGLAIVLPLFQSLQWGNALKETDTLPLAEVNKVNWGVAFSAINAVFLALTFVAAQGAFNDPVRPSPPTVLVFVSSVAGGLVNAAAFGGLRDDWQALSSVDWRTWLVMAALAVGVHTLGNVLLLGSVQEVGASAVAATLPVRLISLVVVGKMVDEMWPAPWAEAFGIAVISATVLFLIFAHHSKPTPPPRKYERVEAPTFHYGSMGVIQSEGDSDSA